MGTVGHSRRFCRRFRAGSVAQQALPELAELLVQFFILQITKFLARDHHDSVQASQLLLVMAEGFTEKAFEAVALDSEPTFFLPITRPRRG